MSTKIGKRLANTKKALNLKEVYSLDRAVKLIKENANAKFDETIELCVALGIDLKKQDQGVRGVTKLPNGSGKVYRVAVFAKDEKAKEAKDAGADVVGAEELVDMIQKGDTPFDKCVATPDMMALVGRVGKVLGPKGLMPNPKLGTVTVDVVAAVKDIKGGQIEYRTEKNGLVQARVGKASFSEESLIENIKHLVDVLNKSKIQGVKGNFLKKMTLSSTMGIGLSFFVNG